MKSDSVALSFHNTAIVLEKAGFKKVIFYLDQNPTHKELMKYNLALLPSLNIQLDFQYLPAYSPKMNVVEYLIHLIRQKKLHHAPHKRNLKAITQELNEFLHLKAPFKPEIIYNIFDHVFGAI